MNMDSIWIVLFRKFVLNKFEYNLYYLKMKGKFWKVIKNISISDSILGIIFINDLIGFILL